MLYCSVSLNRLSSGFQSGRRLAIGKPTLRTLATVTGHPARFRHSAPLATTALLGGAGLFCWFWGKEDSQPLSYAHFTPLTIQSIRHVTSDTSLVSLALPAHLLPSKSGYPEPADTPLQAIYIRQPELQIQRAYTPLRLDCFGNGERAQDAQTIDLLIKRYNDGEVSSYVHRQKAGDKLYIRGPVRTWTLPHADELIFIAGGTGLTPLIQLLQHRGSLPRSIKVIYAASTPERSLIDWLPRSENTQVLDVKGRVTAAHIDSFVGKPPRSAKAQIIVCGSEEFIKDIAGQRSLNAQQDTVGGVLGQLGWTHENVKKL